MLDKKGTSLEIILDDGFTGTMYGLPEESSGCKMKGKIVLNNRHAISAKRLSFTFTGRITVACGPPMYSTRPEYSESQIICRKEMLFCNSSTSNRKIPCGTQEYHFEFELPGHLPSSFKGSRGRIEYYCTALLVRPKFHSDISVKKAIQIKRCLINETREMQSHHTTFSEGLLDDKISYQIITPIMTFHNGGLIQTELTLKYTDPETVIESVEYGLKEQIQYRTTGEQINGIIAKVDESRFPLGEDRVESVHDSNPVRINVRLCPWVNCDVDSQLISVSHKLSFTVCVSEKISDENEGRETDRRSSQRLSFPILGLSRDGREGRINSLPPTRIAAKRSSRTFSLSSVMNPRTTHVAKIERKRLHFEIPIIVTIKSTGQGQTPSYAHDQADRPPDYTMATMHPPPPLYTGAPDRFNLLQYEHDFSNDYVAHDDEMED